MDLSKDDPNVVKALLQFCYTGDYTYDTALHAKVSKPEFEPMKPFKLAELSNRSMQ